MSTMSTVSLGRKYCLHRFRHFTIVSSPAFSGVLYKRKNDTTVPNILWLPWCWYEQPACFKDW